MAALAPSIVNLPPGSERVTDADEEVFLLYSLLASASPTGDEKESGLGFVDSKKREITVAFDIVPPQDAMPTAVSEGSLAKGRSKDKRNRRRSSGKMDLLEGKHVEVTLAQDLSGLKNRKGDTGSVLWRASIHLAHLLLQQHYYPPPSPLNPLLDSTLLPKAHILELGSGTGLLSLLLSPLVRKYTATDVPALLPLLRKNTASNGLAEKVQVEELDWVVLEGLSEERRKRYFPLEDPPDLVLAVDCLYNPSLLRPFLATLCYLSRASLCRASDASSSGTGNEPEVSHGPAVLVMSELRDPEVMREFLALWLQLDREEGEESGWEIWRAGEGLVEGTRCVIWVGWSKRRG